MYYHATGEGHIHEVRFCYADNKEDAIIKHMDAFGYNDVASRDYFKIGVEVMPFNSKRAKQILTEIFKEGDGLHKTLMEAGQEFQFKLQYNYS